MEEQKPAEETVVQEENSLAGMLGNAGTAPKQESPNERISRLFKSSPPPVAPRPEPEQQPEVAAEPEKPAFKSMIEQAGQISAEAEPSQPMEPTPAVETYTPARQMTVPSGQETQSVQYSTETPESEEDIIKEFNSLIKPDTGAAKADIEYKRAAKADKKEKKKLRQKIVFEAYDPEKHGAMAMFPGIQGYEEVERYWADEPYAFVVILYNEGTNNYLYYVAEPSLTVFEKELLIEVYDRLQDVLMMENLDATADRKELLKDKTTQIINDYIGKIDTKSYYKI